jgi:TRAP-type C4-dicarboxylate transport system permease small subunit
MKFLDKLSRTISQVLIGIAGLFLAAMILITCANIFLRAAWIPIKGTYELMGYFGAVAMALSLGQTQIGRGHIAVDLLVLRFSGKKQRVLNGINAGVCTVFFSVVAWQIGKYATTLLRTGEVTETLRIIYYPFTYGVALGCAALALIFLVELILSIAKKGEEAN